MKKTIAILSALIRHNGFEHMRPMLVKFPHSCLFGTCKASSLAAPCKNSCVKIFRRIGSASSKRANFLQEKAKAQLIVASINEHFNALLRKICLFEPHSDRLFYATETPALLVLLSHKRT